MRRQKPASKSRNVAAHAQRDLEDVEQEDHDTSRHKRGLVLSASQDWDLRCDQFSTYLQDRSRKQVTTNNNSSFMKDDDKTSRVMDLVVVQKSKIYDDNDDDDRKRVARQWYTWQQNCYRNGTRLKQLHDLRRRGGGILCSDPLEGQQQFERLRHSPKEVIQHATIDFLKRTFCQDQTTKTVTSTTRALTQLLSPHQFDKLCSIVKEHNLIPLNIVRKEGDDTKGIFYQQTTSLTDSDSKRLDSKRRPFFNPLLMYVDSSWENNFQRYLTYMSSFGISSTPLFVDHILDPSLNHWILEQRLRYRCRFQNKLCSDNTTLKRQLMLPKDKFEKLLEAKFIFPKQVYDDESSNDSDDDVGNDDDSSTSSSPSSKFHQMLRRYISYTTSICQPIPLNVQAAGLQDDQKTAELFEWVQKQREGYENVVHCLLWLKQINQCDNDRNYNKKRRQPNRRSLTSSSPSFYVLEPDHYYELLEAGFLFPSVVPTIASASKRRKIVQQVISTTVTGGENFMTENTAEEKSENALRAVASQYNISKLNNLLSMSAKEERTAWEQHSELLTTYENKYKTCFVDPSINISLYMWLEEQNERFKSGIRKDDSESKKKTINNVEKEVAVTEERTIERGAPLMRNKSASFQAFSLFVRGSSTSTTNTTVVPSSWAHHFEELKRYHKRYHTFDVRKEHNGVLYEWVVQQIMFCQNRLLYEECNGTPPRRESEVLSDERYLKLKEIGFPFDVFKSIVPLSPWDEHFKRLKKYKEKYGTCDVKLEHDSELRKWTRYQEFYYRNRFRSQVTLDKSGNQMTKYHQFLSDDRYEKLLSIGFSFTKDITRIRAPRRIAKKPKQTKTFCRGEDIIHQPHSLWVLQFEELKRYHERYHTFHVKKEHDPVLYEWVVQQIMLYQNRSFAENCKEPCKPSPHRGFGILSDGRYMQLKQIGFTFDELKCIIPKSPWDEHFERLQKYKEKHGTFDVDVEIDRDLRYWNQQQVHYYKNRFRSNSVTVDKDGNEVKKNFMALRDDRYEKLRSIGFPFPDMTGKEFIPTKGKPDEAMFDARLKELVSYHKEHGTWKVDYREPLYVWVKNIKGRYKNRIRAQNSIQTTGHQKYGVLSDRHYEELCKVGYEFPPVSLDDEPKLDADLTLEEKWDHNLSQLVEYHEEHGTWTVHKKINKPLCLWEKFNRYCYNNRIKVEQMEQKDGDDSDESDGEASLSSALQFIAPNGKKYPTSHILSDERYEKLRNVGYDFERRLPVFINRNGQIIEARFKELIAYHEEHGTWQVDPKVNKKLWNWERGLRIRFRNTTRMKEQDQETQTDKSKTKILSDDYYEELKKIGYEVSPDYITRAIKRNAEIQWDQILNELVEYHTKHGTWNIDQNVNISLFRWVRHVRKQYRKMIKVQQNEAVVVDNKGMSQAGEGTSSSPASSSEGKEKIPRCDILSNERYEKLKSVGYEFPTQPVNVVDWDERLNDLVEYHAKNGTWEVDPKVDKSLWAWETRIRYFYLCKIRTQYGKKYQNRDILSDERYEKLCSVGYEFPPIPPADEHTKMRKGRGKRTWSYVRQDQDQDQDTTDQDQDTSDEET